MYLAASISAIVRTNKFIDYGCSHELAIKHASLSSVVNFRAIREIFDNIVHATKSLRSFVRCSVKTPP